MLKSQTSLVKLQLGAAEHHVRDLFLQIKALTCNWSTIAHGETRTSYMPLYFHKSPRQQQPTREWMSLQWILALTSCPMLYSNTAWRGYKQVKSYSMTMKKITITIWKRFREMRRTFNTHPELDIMIASIAPGMLRSRLTKLQSTCWNQYHTHAQKFDLFHFFRVTLCSIVSDENGISSNTSVNPHSPAAPRSNNAVRIMTKNSEI